ncbi:MAG TPA: hypothetical protein VF677_15010 [Flavobacterium sp.]|jgi:hypothetical protein
MASIKLISGKYNQKLSAPNTRWVLLADEKVLFEVPEWVPQATTGPSLIITPVPDTTINSPEAVTWKVLDKSQKETLTTIPGDTLRKLQLAVNKKLSGSYHYYLEATNTKGDKAICAFSGSCDQKITLASWSKKGNASEQGELNYGSSLYITLDTEGLNGDKLTLEIYSKKDDKTPLFTTPEECINGECMVKCNTIALTAVKDKKESEEFVVKVKSPAGKYIKKGSDEKVVTFSITNKTIAPEVEVPQNLTVLEIGEPDKSTLTTGIISLDKVAVKTDYDVCNDEVGDSKDYKNFWILEDKGKYYHWLKTRTNTEDTTKPTPLPITLASGRKFEFTATFITILPIDGIQVRVRDKHGKYTFANKPHPKKANGEEHPIEFKSTDTPYKDTVQYFSDTDPFELIFDYTLDGISWTPLGSVRFELYITWKEPEYAKFIFDSDPLKTMRIECNASAEKNILETLLWLGCNQAQGKGKNEEEILDAAFKKFESRIVTRAREGKKRPDGITPYLIKDWSTEGLGYWRGTSSPTPPPPPPTSPKSTFANDRSLRYLLSKGEARCGEWTNFIEHLCLTQGITDFDTVAVATNDMGHMFKSSGLTTGNVNKIAEVTSLPDMYTMGFPKGEIYIKYTKFHPKSSGSLDASLSKAGLKEELLLVKNCKIIDRLDSTGTIIPDELINDQKSQAQGNDDAVNVFWDHIWFRHKGSMRFLDASYGKSFSSKAESTLENYCNKMLDGLYFHKDITPKGKKLYIRHYIIPPQNRTT